MLKFRDFLKTLFIGGLVVILPIAILYNVILWLYSVITSTLRPLSLLLIRQYNFTPALADWVAVGAAIIVCFVLGFIVRTKAGGWLYGNVQGTILSKVPGYKVLTDIIGQFTSESKRAFSDVVVVQFSHDGPRFTGFITDNHNNDDYTVFIPTGPNPTSGIIVHTTRDNLTFLDATVENTMKTILACGAGSSSIIHNQQ